jgi:hypothetical protein
MNTYGKTNCPACNAENPMYRPLSGRLDSIRNLPAWDEVRCWNCGHTYKHTDVINNGGKIV